MTTHTAGTLSPTPPVPPVPPGGGSDDGVRRRRIAVVAVVLVQLALVAVAVWSPLAARLTGEEVRLRVAPVDPIDPFRGAYVDLSYPDLAGQPGVPGTLSDADQKAFDEQRGVAYLPLTREGEVWVGREVLRERPSGGPYLRCNDSDWRMECGIESWFLPQDEARALEDAVRAGTAVATLRVDARGNAALVGVDPR